MKRNRPIRPIRLHDHDHDHAAALLDNASQLNQPQGRRVELVREVDRRNAGVSAGAANTQQWVAGLLHITTAEAGGLVKLALGCEADVAYLVKPEDLPGRVTLLTDKQQRLFQGRMRRLLELRDQGCAFPGCDRPPNWCHAHHITPWSKGGPTTRDNGVLLCGYHHRLIHQGAWQIRIAKDGLPEFLPPDWLDTSRRPRRNRTPAA